MTDDVSLAKNVIAKAEIVSVRLVSSRTDCSVGSPQEAGTAPVRFRQAFRATRTENGFRVLVDLGFTIPGKEENGPTAVNVDSTFEVDYLLPSELSSSDEELNAFARVNARFNAWPYFREFVQASMARMQLPPIVLPLMRVRSAAMGAEPAKSTLPTGETSQPSLAPSSVTPDVKKESM